MFDGGAATIRTDWVIAEGRARLFNLQFQVNGSTESIPGSVGPEPKRQ